MISGPEFWVRYREDEVTRQQVRPGTVRRVWPYLRRYRGPMVLLLGVAAVDSAIVVVSTLILRLIIDDGILRHRESVVVTLALTVAGLASLRSVVGVVPQDAHLFHDTIRANLLYARPSATEKELIEACEAARIWNLLRERGELHHHHHLQRRRRSHLVTKR